MEDDKLHIFVLKAFDELKFNVGRKTLIDFLKGNPNKTISNNALDELQSFGVLYKLEINKIRNLINFLIKENLIEEILANGKYTVIRRTILGTEEIYLKKLSYVPTESNYNSQSYFLKHSLTETPITETEKKTLKTFEFFLDGFNLEQQRAIISDYNSILTIAGAGSGKTTALVKRIEFLIKFKGIKSKEILAITFTKKAKSEMKERLHKIGIEGVYVETFNSFSEKFLRSFSKKNNLTTKKVASFSDKIKIIRTILENEKIHFELIIDEYFSKVQVRTKTRDELFFIFVRDIFSIIDYYKNSKKDIQPFYLKETNPTKRRIAEICFNITQKALKKLHELNLRDFTDQIIETNTILEKYPTSLKEFKHLLVDEFQDVNSLQINLIKNIKHKNLYAVGDPRQAIYGWRGSEIEYIIDFEKYFSKSQIITFKTNYRSTNKLIDFFNQISKPFKLGDINPNLSIENKTDSLIEITECDKEELEIAHLLEKIQTSKTPRNQIFVLARTNRTLEEFAVAFQKKKIPYTIKSEEEYKIKEPTENEITLATVHSIKGMEAEEVYLVRANSLNFPNKVQDNFVFSLIKEDSEYNKNAEELRLFYVAITRAKKNLYLSFTGNLTYFLTSESLQLAEFKNKNKSLFNYSSDLSSQGNEIIIKNLLKSWRVKKANEKDLPSYMILSNKAIDEISRMKPTSKIHLLSITGMGEKKVSEYGDEIIEIINK